MSHVNWFAVNRRLFDHWLWREDVEPATRFEAWIYILNRANWKDNKTRLGNKFYDVERGSFITSQKKLEEELSWGREKVRAFLDLLKNDGMVTIKTTSLYTKIKVINYDTYQVSQPSDHTANHTAEQPTDHTTEIQARSKVPTTENKVNKDQEGINKEKKLRNPLIPFEGEITFPTNIDTPKCREEWNRWLTEKHAKRKGYKTRDSMETELRRLAKNLQTPDRFCEAIDFSIGKNYTGVFEEAPSRSQNGAKAAPQAFNIRNRNTGLEALAKIRREAEAEEEQQKQLEMIK